MHLGCLVRVVLKTAGTILLLLLRITGILFRYGTSTVGLDSSVSHKKIPDVVHFGNLRCTISCYHSETGLFEGHVTGCFTLRVAPICLA